MRRVATRDAPPAALLLRAALVWVLAVLLPGSPLEPEAAAQILPGFQAPAEEAAGEAAAAEEPPAEPVEPEEEELPPVSELVPRVLAAREEARGALAIIREVSEVAEIEERADELAAARDGLAERLDEALTQEYVSNDRAAAIVEQAAHEARRAAGVMEAASARLEELDALRREWRTRLETWRRWRQALAEDPQLGDAYAEQVDGALQAVEGVLAAADGALPELVRLQEELLATHAGLRRVVESGQAVLRTWRSNLFERSAPVLLSPAHRELIGTGVLAAARRGGGGAPPGGGRGGGGGGGGGGAAWRRWCWPSSD